MVYKSGQIFLPFCHDSRVWQTDRQTEFSSLYRVCITCSAVIKRVLYVRNVRHHMTNCIRCFCTSSGQLAMQQHVPGCDWLPPTSLQHHGCEWSSVSMPCCMPYMLQRIRCHQIFVLQPALLFWRNCSKHFFNTAFTTRLFIVSPQSIPFTYLHWQSVMHLWSFL